LAVDQIPKIYGIRRDRSRASPFHEVSNKKWQVISVRSAAAGLQDETPPRDPQATLKNKLG